MIDLFTSKEIFTIEEVSDRLKISVATLRDKVFRNRIPYFKLGTGLRAPVRFYGAQLNKWMTENEKGRDKPGAPDQEEKRKIKKTKKADVKEFNEYLENLTNE